MEVNEAVRLGELVGDRYVILERVGRRGGQATVYLALDEPGDRYVAVKVLHPHTYRSEREQVEREIEVLRTIDSPYVVRLLDVVEVPPAFGRAATRGLVMELADSSLEDHIAEGSGADVRLLRTAFHDVAAGLADLHAASVTHNDVKPSNILRFGDHWKLADVGIATTLDGTHAYHHWQDSAYAAPERQARGEVRPEGDLWSFGVTVHRAVTGQPGLPDKGRIRALGAPWRQIVAGCLVDNPAQRISLVDLQRKLPRPAEPSETLPRKAPPPPDPPHRVIRAPRRRPVALVAGAVALAVFALAVAFMIRRGPLDGSTPAVAETPRAGGKLVYGLAADPGLPVDNRIWTSATLQLANALYDPLAAFDASGTVQPYLAESVVSDADFRTWTIRLRPNVVFTDGRPMVAADVVEGMRRSRMHPITAPALMDIEDVRAVDDRTVKISMSRPWATFPIHLTGRFGFVYRDPGVPDSMGTGTGPFRLLGSDGGTYHLVRNPTYWRAGLPRLEAVDLVVEESGLARAEAVERGGLDAAAPAPPEKTPDGPLVSAGRQWRRARFEDGGDGPVMTLVFNTARPLLNDIRVRTALALATDLRGLPQVSGWSGDQEGAGPFPTDARFGTWPGNPPLDLAKARRLGQEYLGDERVPNRRREIALTLHTRIEDVAFGRRLTDRWREAGINATVVGHDNLERLALLGEFDVALMDWPQVSDADQLWPLLSGETLHKGAVSPNVIGLDDPLVTSELAFARSTTDPMARTGAYTKVQAAIARTVPALWLLRHRQQLITSARVHDLRNVTLPDGREAMPFVEGAHRLTETWLTS